MTFTQWFQSWAGEGFGWFLANTALILAIALPLMLAVAMIIYADRKIWAAMALRRGPNVVGPLGLLQSFADGLKVFLQETIIPSASNKGLFLLAPIITFAVALIVWAVIPFGAGMVLADINVGLLYILAASSLGVYGVIISGWSSNSKYPFYSALRAAAQMVSYEVSIGFILISVVLWAGTFNLSGIVEGQKAHVFGFLNGYGFNPLLFPMAVMFLISALAETARAPFDLTEAESELVAGYQTEYSSMSFALFWLGEYANVILMCALNAILFWGGYLPPFDWAPLYAVPGILWLFLKIGIFFFIFSWIKATVPRYRYDQLMRLGWKVFLPISLFWVFLVSGYLMLTRYGPEHRVGQMMQSVAGGVKGDALLTGYRCGMLPGTGETFQLGRSEIVGKGTTSWELRNLGGVAVISGSPFEANTGSIAGSEGINYRGPDGKPRSAYVSFSDVVGEMGPTELYLSFDKIDGDKATTCEPWFRKNLNQAKGRS